MDLFTPEDRQLIEESSFVPGQPPTFEWVRGCLAWADEWPKGISLKGQRRVHDLVTARSYLYHRTHPRYLAQFPSADAHAARALPRYQPIWDQAIAMGLRWSGFHPSRLQLSEADIEFLFECLNHEGPI